MFVRSGSGAIQSSVCCNIFEKDSHCGEDRSAAVLDSERRKMVSRWTTVDVVRVDAVLKSWKGPDVGGGWQTW
jgi:hypothetical protein